MDKLSSSSVGRDRSPGKVWETDSPTAMIQDNSRDTLDSVLQQAVAIHEHLTKLTDHVNAIAGNLGRILGRPVLPPTEGCKDDISPNLLSVLDITARQTSRLEYLLHQIGSAVEQ